MKYHTLSLCETNPDFCVLDTIVAGDEDRVFPAYGMRWGRTSAPAFTHSMAPFHAGIRPADIVANCSCYIILSDAAKTVSRRMPTLRLNTCPQRSGIIASAC